MRTLTKEESDEIDRKVEEIARRCKYEGYLRSKTWHNKRHNALVAADFTCSICGYCSYKAIFQIPLDVHHKTYERLGSELPEDLEVLCRNCHEARHAKGL